MCYDYCEKDIDDEEDLYQKSVENMLSSEEIDEALSMFDDI
jgi:hypothetical protein